MSTGKFTFFWNGPFSQWESCTFKVDGITYNCAEQYMMAKKAKLFKDEDTYEKIMEATHPREQKKLGRQVKGFHADRWNNVAREIVYEGNHAKFTQNPKLLKKLLETKGTTLVEASPYDCIWGIGMREGDKGVNDRSNWRGKNWLGEVLTGLREDLIDKPNN
jgi:ribA/ribD-fused uncharacterized protein